MLVCECSIVGKVNLARYNLIVKYPASIKDRKSVMFSQSIKSAIIIFCQRLFSVCGGSI